MLLRQALGAPAVPRLNRLQQLLVLARDSAVPRIGLRQKRHGVVELHAYLFDGVGEDRVAGRARHGDVEVGVVAHVLGFGRRGRHALDRLAHGRQVGVATCASRHARHGRLDQSSVLEQILQLFAMPHHAQDQLVGRERIVVSLGDECPAASTASGLDQPAGLQHSERVLDRRPADAEHHGQLAFGGQRLTWLDQTQRDVAADLFGHVFMRPQLLDPLEADARRDLRPVRLNGHLQPSG